MAVRQWHDHVRELLEPAPGNAQPYAEDVFTAIIIGQAYCRRYCFDASDAEREVFLRLRPFVSAWSKPVYVDRSRRHHYTAVKLLRFVRMGCPLRGRSE